MYWILFIGIALASWLVQANLKNKFEKYSKIPIDGGLTGRDIAVKMLHDNGIYDIKLVTNSGNDVPKATTVKPITISVTLNRRAKPVAPSVNLSAPSNTSAIPTTSNTTVKNIPSAF